MIEPVQEPKIAPVKADYAISNIPRPSAEAQPTALPSYKLIGEAFNSYVMVESEGKLLMIDKHAAHERILFEDMKKSLLTASDSQILLVPISVSITGEELDCANEYRAELTSMGFDFTDADGSHTVSVTAIPSSLSAAEAEELFVTVVGRLASGTGNLDVTRSIFFEQALYQASCKAAIKAGRIYDEAHVKWVCERVLSDPAIRFCPHGRPVAFELSRSELEHRFKRS